MNHLSLINTGLDGWGWITDDSFNFFGWIIISYTFWLEVTVKGHNLTVFSDGKDHL